MDYWITNRLWLFFAYMADLYLMDNQWIKFISYLLLIHCLSTQVYVTPHNFKTCIKHHITYTELSGNNPPGV